MKLSVVSSNIGSNNFGLRKMAPQSRNAKYAIMSTLIFKCHWFFEKVAESRPPYFSRNKPFLSYDTFFGSP